MKFDKLVNWERRIPAMREILLGWMAGCAVSRNKTSRILNFLW